MPDTTSEVARLLHRIEQEYEAAQRGLTGFAAVARHEVIMAHMENIHGLHCSLQELVGDEAIKLVFDVLEEAGKKHLSHFDHCCS